MCEPTSIAAVVGIASTAFGAYSQIQQGKYQEGVADYNARVAENQAQEVRNKATEEENTHREKVQQLLSRQRAQLGASNVQLTSGSALQLQEDTLTLGEADALRIRDTGDSQFSALNTQADLISDQGDMASTASKTAAAGTLLSGTASFLGTGIADKWFTPTSSINQPNVGP